MKRKHQREFEQVIDGIIAGSVIRNIIVKATPGSGKSTIPIIAGKLKKRGLADKLCWICPRLSLQDQAERNFLDPFFRDMFNHKLTIRASTNEADPCRGTDGFVTTYQALGVDDRKSVLSEFKRRKYILILDEYHHAAEDGAWTRAIRELYDAAAYRVLMTGTMNRGDGGRIAFTNYAGGLPDLNGDQETAVVDYSRRDALADRAILPVTFRLSDGQAKWQNKQGKVVEAALGKAEGQKATFALYTALHTEFAQELLTAAVSEWRTFQGFRDSARLLVVAAGIEAAKEHVESLTAMGIKRVEIATSEDSKAAAKVIKAFKSGAVDVLVSVAMAYEGLDVPAISHIACLTNIRSLPWIEQMVARAVRIDPQAGPYEAQRAYVYAPNDLMFQEITAKIEAEQMAPIIERQARETTKSLLAGAENGTLFDMGITPLSSSITGTRNVVLECKTAPVYYEGPTVSERVAYLRKEANEHVQSYCRAFCCRAAYINRKLKDDLGKGREEMTEPELQTLIQFLNANYAIPAHKANRGLFAKAQRINVAWRDNQ